MREIRFRARNAELPRCWVYGYFCVENGHNYIINKDGKFKVIAGTEGQYTGLKVENGEELYEDDIVKMPYTHDFGEIEKVGVIEYDATDAVFCIDFPNDGMTIPLWRFNQNRIEKIGNHIEHPELLEGGS